MSFKIVLNKSGLKWYKIFLKVKLKEVFVKKIIMSGQGHNFELWDENTWHKQFESLDALSKQTKIPIEISQLSP